MSSSKQQTIVVEGKRFALVAPAELERLRRLAKLVEAKPPIPPKPDDQGRVPARQYIRYSVARDIIKGREELGLSQRALAKLACVRQEVLCRLEGGKHSPTLRTVEKIERALATERKRQQGRKGK